MRSVSSRRPSAPAVSTALRLALLAAIVFLVWSTTADTESMTAGIWDKSLHFLAFYCVSVLSALAFPRWNLFLLFLAMGLIGVGIEGLQALPFVPHAPSLGDVIADLAGAAAGLGPIFADRLRRRLSASRWPRRSSRP